MEILIVVLKASFLFILIAFSAGAESATTQNDLFPSPKKKSILFQLPPILAAQKPTLPPPPINRNGHITFTIEQIQDVRSEVFRIKAIKGATPENISNSLNRLSPVSTPYDRMLNSSPNGKWLLLGTTRFNPECASWECLAIVKGDLSSGNALVADGALIHPEGWSAVSSNGDFVVFPQNGDGRTDLWGISKNSSGNWNAPLNLTGNSTSNINIQPALSADGSKIVFQCNKPNQSDSEAICQVNSDGTDFRVTVTAEMINSSWLNQPDYAPNGSIVFEDAGGNEQIWRLSPGSTITVKNTNTFSNDNSHCVLTHGRVVSLWIRDNHHQMKVMNADDSSYFMLMEGVDVSDTGLGCSD